MESALLEGPSAEVYYCLAEVLTRKIERERKSGDKSAAISRARHYCDAVRRTDWVGEWKDQISEISKRLDAAPALVADNSKPPVLPELLPS